MTNPDKLTSNVDVLTVAFPVSILFLLLTMFIFQFRDTSRVFKLILWVGLPLVGFLLVTAINFVTQYISCKKLNAGKAFLGALPSLGAILIGLGISSISFCRIPIVTVFTPMIVGKSVDVTKNKSTTNINSLKVSNSKECCIPKLTLESIESKFPIISGLTYGFYLMFSVLFGVTIGNGIATTC